MKLATIFFIILIYTVHSQPVKFVDYDIYNWFDSEIGIGNTNLYNGIDYYQKHFVINENKHPFFNNVEPTLADIIYDGQEYANVLINYEVYTDEILLSIKNDTGISIIQLVKDKVSEFYFSNKNFRNVDKLNVSSNKVGFCELIYDSKTFAIFKKYHKKKAEKLDKNFVYNEFKDDKNNFFLVYNNKFFELNSPKRVSNIFPEFKKNIRKYINANLAKNDKETSYRLLFAHLEELISKNTNQIVQNK